MATILSWLLCLNLIHHIPPILLHPRGGVLPMWWVIHMCSGFDPLFSLWQDRARSFWGTFSHPPTAKLSFGVQKLPIFTKIDLFGPKFNFFLDLFGSNFQRPAAHPHQFSGRVPPRGYIISSTCIPLTCCFHVVVIVSVRFLPCLAHYVYECAQHFQCEEFTEHHYSFQLCKPPHL